MSKSPVGFDRESMIRLLAATAVGWVAVAVLSVTLASVAALATGYWSIIFTILLFLVIVGVGTVLAVVALVIVVRLWWNLHRHQFVNPDRDPPEPAVDVDELDSSDVDPNWEEVDRG